VIAQGAVMAAAGIIAGAIFGYVIARVANSYVVGMRMPDFGPVVISAIVLLAAAVIASVLPAARAARIDVMSALRSE
jgi:putative ABC transport system permease protein